MAIGLEPDPLQVLIKIRPRLRVCGPPPSILYCTERHERDMAGYLVAYDAGCSRCSRFARLAALLGRPGRVTAVPLDIADSAGLLDPVPSGRRYLSFHLIGSDGQVSSGAEALMDLVSVLPLGKLSSVCLRTNAMKYATRSIYSAASRLHDGCGARCCSTTAERD